MTAQFPWLPDLVLLESHGGSWESYENELYYHFCEDFVHSSPSYLTLPPETVSHAE